MNVNIRFIPKNTESFLFYAKNDCIGVVIFLNQKMTPKGNKQTETWTKYLIDTDIKLNGTYYLPIQLHADKQQIEKVYPQINEFFTLKRKYDPMRITGKSFLQKICLIQLKFTENFFTRLCISPNSERLGHFLYSTKKYSALRFCKQY